MELWLMWLIVTIIFIILEIFTPGFLIAIFSIGSLLAMIIAFFIKNIYIQLFIFSLANLLSYIFLRPIFIKLINKTNEKNKTNVDLLIGKKVKIIEKVDNIAETGRVKISGVDWKAVSIDDNITFEVDEIAEIVKVQGAKVIIKKID